MGGDNIFRRPAGTPPPALEIEADEHGLDEPTEDSVPQLATCPNCDRTVTTQDYTCPYCGSGQDRC